MVNSMIRNLKLTSKENSDTHNAHTHTHTHRITLCQHAILYWVFFGHNDSIKGVHVYIVLQLNKLDLRQ